MGDRIHASDRSVIKEKIVGLMLSSPEQIQKTGKVFYSVFRIIFTA